MSIYPKRGVKHTCFKCATRWIRLNYKIQGTHGFNGIEFIDVSWVLPGSLPNKDIEHAAVVENLDPYGKKLMFCFYGDQIAVAVSGQGIFSFNDYCHIANDEIGYRYCLRVKMVAKYLTEYIDEHF